MTIHLKNWLQDVRGVLERSATRDSNPIFAASLYSVARAIRRDHLELGDMVDLINLLHEMDAINLLSRLDSIINYGASPIRRNPVDTRRSPLSDRPWIKRMEEQDLPPEDSEFCTMTRPLSARSDSAGYASGILIPTGEFRLLSPAQTSQTAARKDAERYRKRLREAILDGDIAPDSKLGWARIVTSKSDATRLKPGEFDFHAID